MANKVTKMRRSLRKLDFQGGRYKYFRGSTLTYASPTFTTKKDARKWLKAHPRG